MFDDATIREISRLAKDAGVEPAALLAIAEVESGGAAFAVVDGRREPLIRFEGHYFDRRLGEADRRKAREAGLASPVAGAIANPRTQAGRWRMLREAAAIDRRAAHESVSWGVGQVMGAHWQPLGYADVEALVAEARGGISGQVALMLRYIDSTGLCEAIRRRDWTAFARAYNGPGFGRSGYDRRIAAAFARWQAGKEGSERRLASVLAEGAAGDAVADLQRSLAALGYGVAVDGLFGAATARAVRAFQAAQGLAPDGIAGERTLARIAELLAQPAPSSLWTRLAAWLRRLLGWK